MDSSVTQAIAEVRIGEKFNPPFTELSQTGSLVSAVVSTLYILAGVVLLVLIILGGLGLIMGAGQSDPQKTAQGKKAVTTAVAGFLIIFASYWIIQLIEVSTGVDILK